MVYQILRESFLHSIEICWNTENSAKCLCGIPSMDKSSEWINEANYIRCECFSSSSDSMRGERISQTEQLQLVLVADSARNKCSLAL